MKKEQTPQQPHEMYEGGSKVVYTVNADGKYELSSTTGWEPETIVLSQALEEIDRLSQLALQNVQQGISSPLEYHMYAQRMDLQMLAAAVGKFQWQVKRHFKPSKFVKLSQQQVKNYASVLGITDAQLRTIPND